MIIRPSGGASATDSERASLLRQCKEKWTNQLRDVLAVLSQNAEGIAASFYDYRMQFNSSSKKDVPRTEAEVRL